MERKWRRWMSVLLAFAMVISLCIPNTLVSAATDLDDASSVATELSDETTSDVDGTISEKTTAEDKELSEEAETDIASADMDQEDLNSKEDNTVEEAVEEDEPGVNLSDDVTEEENTNTSVQNDSGDDPDHLSSETPSDNEADTEASDNLSEDAEPETPDDDITKNDVPDVENDTADESLSLQGASEGEPSSDEESDEENTADGDEAEAETDEEEEVVVGVAEYNGKQYETLQAAFDAVGEAWKELAPSGEFESSSTITLLTSVTENISFSITPTGGSWSNLDLTLDLNGYTLSGTGDTSSTKGAIWLYRGSSYTGGGNLYFTVKNGTITGGYATSNAGAVYFSGTKYGTLTFENVTFTGNTGSTAGAVAGGSSITAVNCTFSNNTATGSTGAGAILSSAGTTLSLTNCVITGNSGGSGGGIKVLRAASSNTTLDLASGNNVIYGNSASTAGDDIFITASSGSKTLTVNLASAASLSGGMNAALYEDGTYDDSSIAEGSRYSEGNETEISGSVQLCYSSDSTLNRSMGIKVASILSKYIVTYTDGSGEALYFEDQTYTVTEGNTTPAFEGEPTRDGYVFDGWEPEVADTVTGDVTYTAKWKALYTVTYTDGSGSESYFADETYTIAEGEATPEFTGDATRDGYVFTGWDPEVEETVTGDATYTAQWKRYFYPTSTITASNVKSMNIRAYFIGTDSISTSGTLLNLVPSTAYGTDVDYEISDIYGDLLNGYFVNVTFHFASGDSYESKASTSFNTNSSFAKTYAGKIEDYYGTWVYDFDYDENYGADQTVVLYWRVVESTGKGSWVLWDTETESVKSTNITSSIATVIHAYLTLPAYTVTYTDGSGSEAYFADEVYTVNNGADTPAFDGEPTRDGYVFDGWDPEVAETVTGDVTYTAQWKALYTVTYTDGSGSEAYFEDQTYTVSDGTETPAFDGEPTRDGYEFDGWVPEVAETVTGDVTYTAKWKALYIVTYTDGSGSESYFADETYTVIEGEATPEFTGNAIRTGYTLSGWTPEIENTVSGDSLYTAAWKANTYTITLDPGEGELSGEDTNTIVVTYDSPIGELPVPAREGYVFEGWVDENGTTVDAETIYTTAGDSTLYASWAVEASQLTPSQWNAGSAIKWIVNSALQAWWKLWTAIIRP